ncbi:MAG: FtsW/RodA/SpoVE family cell cycle protein [bacterium]|nr:FtsW/RodA/SpoVE family cell cycle protein [bacterium]
MRPQNILRFLQRLDWAIIASVATLLFLGFAAIYSVELSRGVGFLLMRKQFVAFFIGIMCSIFLLTRANGTVRGYGRLFYLLGILFLIFVLFFGRTVNGTTGWFSLGIFSFQPVEYMKIALLLPLAHIFGEPKAKHLTWRALWQSVLVLGLPTVLVALQPDYGSAMLMVATWGVMFLFARPTWTQLLALIGGALFAGVIFWGFLLQDYQLERLAVFMNPALDPLDTGYNITQAKIAIGSGGFLGSGLGFGSQSRLHFLPESHTDFIFAVIAEELGFIGVLILLVALSVVFMRTIVLMYKTKNGFLAMLLLGIFALLFTQSGVNIAMNLGLFPTIGVALPFVSYGGSSLIMWLIAVGIIESIAILEGDART